MARLAAAYLLALLAAGAPAGAFRRPLPRTRASSAIGAISSGADFAAPTSEEPLPTQTRPAIPAALVALEEKVNAALRGDAAALRAAIASNVNIDDAALDAKDLAGLEAEVIGVAKLMEDPVLSFVEATDAGADAVRVTWIASGTWGAPWNPRIVATGTADVTLDAATGMVSRVATAWDRSPSSAFFSQIFPDVWDARTWFACPKVERSPYQVVHKGEGFEVRDYLPRTVLKMSFVDPTGKPERKVAKLLPDFCMTGELMTAGRLADPWWATAEPECFIRRLTPEEEVRTLTLTLTLTLTRGRGEEGFSLGYGLGVSGSGLPLTYPCAPTPARTRTRSPGNPKPPTLTLNRKPPEAAAVAEAP
eukprot:CAMPEP_0118883416 /NCGR_PEP_ID=MMETSP1163-20130328/22479_1 /TAXON_ID=124430 /ORGANISM="Phaeomonas parva, Strain CCMP2877" /LENGTH=362 /DNA_ID=CAMNT_0006820807 /DNA_START=70 /DNA_END=1156 /DNA_ORIENTATION=-